MQSTSCLLRRGCLALLALSLWLSSGYAQAYDVRLALLVANEQGWKKDPKLRYVVRGDLMPLARSLRALGFEVKLLKNRDAKALRRMMRWIQARAKRAPQVTTFLFYYSGHSDRKVLHMGPRSKRPVSYKELVSFLRSLRIARRIGILDSCFSGEIIRKFGSVERYQELVAKGARAKHTIDLSQGIPNQGSDERSLQIISSGLDLSWESKRYRASIFTHHLLRGLKGRADQDLDGKISIGELFNFVSNAMERDIRQKPHLFGIVQRSGAYALAPAYNSRLWIGPQVVGSLHVAVANFSWSWNKRQRRPLRLAVIHGKGSVELQRAGRCWRQNILIPKGREFRLGRRWNQVPCVRVASASKGRIELQSRAYVVPIEQQWTLEAQGGALWSQLARQGMLGGGSIALKHRFFGLRLGLWGASTKFQEVSSPQMLFQLQTELGFRRSWGHVDLFLGGFVGASLLLQDISRQTNAGLLLQTGASFSCAYWLSDRWGISLGLDAGLLIGQFGGRWSTPLFGRLSLGLTLRL